MRSDVTMPQDAHVVSGERAWLHCILIILPHQLVAIVPMEARKMLKPLAFHPSTVPLTCRGGPQYINESLLELAGLEV